MKCDKYMGMDVHQAMTVVVVLDADGKVILETMVGTEAAAIIRLVQSLSGPLRVTFEESTQAAWLYEVIRAYATEVIVCDPRRNKLLEDGSKADKVDARKLAELLRAGLLRSVYHGHEATRNLKELVRAYETLSIDTQRTMARIKAIYRARGIRTPGRGVYQPKQRQRWLELLTEAGIRQRVAWLYEQLDQLKPLRREAKQAMLAESRRHRAVSLFGNAHRAHHWTLSIPASRWPGRTDCYTGLRGNPGRQCRRPPTRASDAAFAAPKNRLRNDARRQVAPRLAAEFRSAQKRL